MLISLLPLFFLYSYSSNTASKILISILRKELTEKAYLVGEDIDRFFQQREYDIRILSQADVLEQGEVGSVIYRDIANESVMAGFADMEEFGINKAMDWSIIAVAPISEITKPAILLNKKLSLFSLLVGFVVLLLSFMAGRSIAIPIRKSADVANQIADGNLNVTIDSNRQDEIGILTKAFNTMAYKLKESYAKLKKIVNILLDNAIKFTPDGGRIKVEVTRIDDKLLFYVLHFLIELSLSVTDTGIGIKPEDKERIFKGFEQVDGSYRKKYGGAGTGTACRVNRWSID